MKPRSDLSTTEIDRTRSSDDPRAEADTARPQTIPDEHRASVMRGLADLRSGRIASDEAVEDAYRRFER